MEYKSDIKKIVSIEHSENKNYFISRVERFPSIKIKIFGENSKKKELSKENLKNLFEIEKCLITFTFENDELDFSKKEYKSNKSLYEIYLEDKFWKKNNKLKNLDKEIIIDYLSKKSNDKLINSRKEISNEVNDIYWQISFLEGKLVLYLSDEKEKTKKTIEGDDLEIKIEFLLKIRKSLENLFEIESKEKTNIFKKFFFFAFIIFFLSIIFVIVKKIINRMFDRIKIIKKREIDKIQRF